MKGLTGDLDMCTAAAPQNGAVWNKQDLQQSRVRKFRE